MAHDELQSDGNELIAESDPLWEIDASSGQQTNAASRVSTAEPEHQARIVTAREQIAAELPDLIARERRMREAAEENTFSGELRRAIHAGDRDLISLAQIVGITRIQLSEFLTGERTLRSDVLDRLVAAVGAHLTATTSN